jgi:hypothetical protein
VITGEKGVPRVKAYTPAGRLESVVAGPEQFDENVKIDDLDLAVDSAGRVLVADPAMKAVRVFVRRTAPPATAGASHE